MMTQQATTMTMKRVMVLLAVLMAALMAMSALSASDAEAKKQKVDSIKGKGTTPFGRSFQFAAKDTDGNPATFDSAGEFSSSQTNGNFVKGEVTCLRVVGDDAFFQGRILESNDPTNVGKFAQFNVTDSPKGGSGDEFSTEGITPDEQQCSEPEGGVVVIDKGSIKVRDVA